MNITEADILLAPDVQGLFENVANGGIALVIKALRYSIDEDIQAFLDKYDKALPREKEHLPIQAWVLGCGIDVHRFIGEAVLALRDYSVNMVKILALSSHPEVMKARIKNAKRPEGVKDREAIDLMLGALPTPKGATFITKQYIQSGSSTPLLPEGEAADEPGEVDLDATFPSLSDTQKKIGAGSMKLPPMSEEEELRQLEAEINGEAT